MLYKKALLLVGLLILALGLNGCLDSNYPPIASFTWAPNPSEAGETVTFVSSSTDDGSIQSWTWDFGDGNTTTGDRVNHVFGAEGTYEVSLTVVDNCGCTDSVKHQIEVFPLPCPPSPPPPCPVPCPPPCPVLPPPCPLPVLYTLTTSVSPSQGGYVTPNCSSGCSYQGGDYVTVTAHPVSGWDFDHWSGDISNGFSRNPSVLVVMNRNRHVVAHFIEECPPPPPPPPPPCPPLPPEPVPPPPPPPCPPPPPPPDPCDTHPVVNVPVSATYPMMPISFWVTAYQPPWHSNGYHREDMDRVWVRFMSPKGNIYIFDTHPERIVDITPKMTVERMPSDGRIELDLNEEGEAGEGGTWQVQGMGWNLCEDCHLTGEFSHCFTVTDCCS